jgi:hypothetical protein
MVNAEIEQAREVPETRTVADLTDEELYGTRPSLRDTAEQLRGRWRDCFEVAALLGLDTGSPRQLRRWRCPAPRCGGHKEPTLSKPRGGGWACFRCGAKGDAFALVGLALGYALPLRGRDFPRAVEWLAQRAGMMVGEAPPPPRMPSPSPERPPFDAAGWWSAHAARSPSAAEWLLSRGIPPGAISSGIVRLDRQGASTLAGSVSRDFLEQPGGAVVAPLRSASTGAVGALHLRVTNATDPHLKRRTVGAKTDPDDTPRGYGRVDRLPTAPVVILTEGLGDTLAAEALTDGADVAVVGVDGASTLPAWGAYLGTLPHRPRVVVVAHLDGDSITAEGTGYRRALEAATAGGAVASWAELVGSLPARQQLAMLQRMASPRGWDLGDTLALCRDDLAALRAAFARAVGLPPPREQPPHQTQPEPAGAATGPAPTPDNIAWTDDEWEALQADLNDTWGEP